MIFVLSSITVHVGLDRMVSEFPNILLKSLNVPIMLSDIPFISNRHLTYLPTSFLLGLITSYNKRTFNCVFLGYDYKCFSSHGRLFSFYFKGCHVLWVLISILSVCYMVISRIDWVIYVLLHSCKSDFNVIFNWGKLILGNL
jgi:hypothetical protein